MRPPTVFADGDDLYATDGHHHWLILADAFGQLLHRTELAGKPRAGKSTFDVTPRGVVHGPKTKATFEMFAGCSSHAASPSTLAITLPHSHHIFLLAEVAK